MVNAVCIKLLLIASNGRIENEHPESVIFLDDSWYHISDATSYNCQPIADKILNASNEI